MADSRKLDRILTVVASVLGIAILAFGGYFGYTVYADRIAADSSTPAMRVVRAVEAQVRQKPNDPVMRARLGEALAAAGKIQEAIEQLNAAIKLDPKHTGAYNDLGLLAMSQGRPVEAQRYFQKVIEITNGSEMQDVNQRREIAFYNLGLVALQQKDYTTAIGQFKQALLIRGDASDTYFYLGQALYLSGEPDAALKQVQTALVFDPNFAQAHYLLGDIYMAKKDRVNASYEYHKAATIDPNAPEPQKAVAQFGDPNVLAQKAKSLMNTDIEAALENILIARNLDPESAADAIIHGDILIKRGNGKDALDVYRQAAKLDPKNQQVQAMVKQLEAKYGKSAAKKK